MKLFEYKGKRIRYSDKNLLLNFALTRLTAILLLVMLLFYGKALVNYDWSGFSLLGSGEAFNNFDLSYLVMAVVVSLLLCGIAVLLYCVFGKQHLGTLKHRQALARMVVENKWYESESRQNSSIFKDLKSSGSKEVITYFPKIYYKFKDNCIILLVEAGMGRSQEQLLKLQNKIEMGLFCEFVEFTEQEPFYKYVFYYKLERARISIDDVVVSKGSVKMMKGFKWNYDKLPHALIVGGTGSGKSFFLLTLIKTLLEAKAKIYILDPKDSDLAYLANVMPDVYFEPEDIIKCVDDFCEGMYARNAHMKSMPNFNMGSNYAALGLEPHFLVFDEYVAFLQRLKREDLNKVLGKLTEIIMLGRNSGYFLILACQRPDSQYLANGIRDQFHFRLALGRNSDIGYKMVFGDTNKTFLTMPAGRGYVDIGKNIISRFYAPLVPEGYDFLGVIEQAAKNNENLKISWESTTPEMLENEEVYSSD